MAQGMFEERAFAALRSLAVQWKLPEFDVRAMEPAVFQRIGRWDFYVLLEVYPNGGTHYMRAEVDDRGHCIAGVGWCAERPSRMWQGQKPVSELSPRWTPLTDTSPQLLSLAVAPSEPEGE